VIFIIIYASIGLSVSFYLCRFILTHNYCVIKNLKTTFENSEIIQTLIKVLNCPDGYKIIFLSRLTPVRKECCILGQKKVSSKFGVYKFKLATKCLLFLNIISQLSTVKSLYFHSRK
jgi:hypothetical protein